MTNPMMGPEGPKEGRAFCTAFKQTPNRKQTAVGLRTATVAAAFTTSKFISSIASSWLFIPPVHQVVNKGCCTIATVPCLSLAIHQKSCFQRHLYTSASRHTPRKANLYSQFWEGLELLPRTTTDSAKMLGGGRRRSLRLSSSRREPLTSIINDVTNANNYNGTYQNRPVTLILAVLQDWRNTTTTTTMAEEAAESPGLDNLFDNFIDNLQLVIDKLKEEDATREPSPNFTLENFWNKLEIAYKAMSAEATKLSLWFSKPPLPKTGECESLLESVQRTSLALVSAYYGLPKEQGLRLRKCLKMSVEDIVEGIQTLAKRIKQEKYQCSQGQLQSTGTVWKVCEHFASLPKNNCEAILQILKSTSELVKDALEELEEAQQTDGGRDSGWDDLDEVLGRVDINSDSNLESWTDIDRAVLPPCIGLVKAARSSLKKVSSAVKNNGQWEDAHSVAQLDDLADIVEQVSVHVDEMVSCVYPPMRQSIVRTNANQLSGVLLQLLSRAKSSHVCKSEDSTWLNFLDHAINHNLEQIKNLTKSNDTA